MSAQLPRKCAIVANDLACFTTLAHRQLHLEPLALLGGEEEL